jgi:ribosome-associated toxin RatA of RatAB toxin-antitoxin module
MPPQVDVHPDGPGVGAVQAHVDINASPEVVWKVLVDCERVPQLMVGVKYCRVLQHDPAGRWDLREQVTHASLLPGVRTVIRSDYDEPSTVRFHRTDGDFKVLEGEWRLEALDGGARTRVSYQSRMSTPFSAPGPIVRAVLRSAMPRTLDNLRDACEAQASARP